MQIEILNNYINRMLEDFKNNSNTTGITNIIDEKKVKFICIIEMFDELYNTLPQMDIYSHLGEQFGYSEEGIRRIIANRTKYMNG